MIEEKDIAQLKLIFVTRQECDSSMDGVGQRLANGDTKFAVIETKLNLITWLIAAVAGGIIAMLIKMFFGG